MWNQWSQYAGAPPLPTTAPPPPPQEPCGGTAAAAPIIGPMLPSATAAPLPAPAVPTAPVGATASPSPLGANPYSQYTAAQYAAMTPEQQYALQQHWLQWQKYQEEYARWHAQYGEQYKREMELAQKATTATPVVSATAVTPAYASNYYQQPPPSAPSNKISGQPQLYSQPPPPQVPAPTVSTSNPSNYSLGPAQQQPPWQPPQQPPQQPPSYNQPPPNFNPQNVNNNNSHMNTLQFHRSPWSGAPEQVSTTGPPPLRQANPDNSQYNGIESGNRGPNAAGGPNNWQGLQNNRGTDNFNTNNAGNRGNGPINHTDNKYNNNQNACGDNGTPNIWNNKESSAMRDFDLKNRCDKNSSSIFNKDEVAPDDKIITIEKENKDADNDDFKNNVPSNRNINRSNNWNDRGNFQRGLETNRGLNSWNERSTDQNFGQNNTGTDSIRIPNSWNDGSNCRSHNENSDWNDNNPNNRGHSDGNYGSNNFGPINCNQGSNTHGPNKWNEGPNSRDANNWNESLNNRGPTNWNDGPNIRGNNGPNDWNDNRTVNDRYFGPNNRGSNNWKDNLNNRVGSSNILNDCNDISNIRGPNFGQNNRGNNRSNEWRNPDRDKRGVDNWEQSTHNNLRRNDGLNQRSGPGFCVSPGSGNRNRVTDLDEEMFDRQFRLWEQQFEDWKKANANHPDREMYKRYEEEFEKQRKRIAERREQMRRRKLEQMGLDPNKAPSQPSPNRSQSDSVENENSDNTETFSRKRNDSVGSQQSSNSKQNQDHNKDFKTKNPQQVQNDSIGSHQSSNLKENPDHNQKLKLKNAQDTQLEITKQIDKEEEPIKNNENSDNAEKFSEETNKTTTVNKTQHQKKSTATQLGKRKSRFDTPVAANKLKPIENSEVINLDDEDVDGEQTEDNQGNMSEIFKKADGIPGLDLTDDASSGPTGTSTMDKSMSNAEINAENNKFSKSQITPTLTPKKIPSLFDIKVNKPDMTDMDDAKKLAAKPTSSTALPDLAKTLNDPDFLKRISEAVANAKGDTSKAQEVVGRQLTFSEWQQRKQGEGAENKKKDDNLDLGNNNIGSFRDMDSNILETGDEFNSNFNANNAGGGHRGGRGLSNNMGCNTHFGSNNNFGPSGPNIWGPSGNNNWGPNGPNNWGPNGPNHWGPNNNYAPNSPSNWGPNGPNNCGPNGPNNWGPTGPNIWASGGSNSWGPNRPDDFGPNNNFRGSNNCGFKGNNFLGNCPNDGLGGNFGRNDGPGRNFDRNGSSFGRNRPNFGNNEGLGRNFDGDGPVRSFGRDGNNFGPDNSHFGPNDCTSPDGNRRNRGRDRRDGSKNRGERSDKRDSSNNRNNSKKDGSNSDEAGTPNRNINNPFRRNDVPQVASLETLDALKSKDQADWMKGPGDRDNLDYGDYYRPVQVIDYSNSNAAPTTTITPRVIDYGHKPVMNDDSNAFKPLKIINYDHASKAKNPQQQVRLNATQKRKKRKNKNNPQQQKKQNQKQKQNKQQQEQEQQQTKHTQQHSQDPAISPNEKKDVQEQKNIDDAGKDQDELEEISDAENMPDEPESPPPPPPPMFNTSGTLTSFALYETPSSLFPSTSDANENLQKMSSAHVQMSIPSEENNNTISIDEILMKPGRQTRPRKICIILRGPPGSGKSHVAKLIKEKEKELGGNNPRILSIDDYFLIENDYEEKCPKTGKKIPKKEILYEYDQEMEGKYLEYLIKAFKKSVADNFYDFIVIDCNNNSLRSLNEFYCHSKDSGFVPYIIDLFCDFETCMERNIHERSEKDIKEIIDTWKPTPGHYIKLDISSLLQNIVEMEDAEDMAVDDNAVSENASDSNMMNAANDQNEADDCTNEDDNYNDEDRVNDNDEDDSNDSVANCGFLKSKWETDTTTENLARLDGTSKLSTKRKPTMQEYLQMDEWQPPTNTKGKKRVRWADIEEKRNQEKMRAVGFVVGQTDWKRMMDPNAAKRALNKTKYIERVNKGR